MNEVEIFYRGLAMLGYLSQGGYTPDEVSVLAKSMAKRMLEEPVKEAGIVAVKRRYAKEK